MVVGLVCKDCKNYSFFYRVMVGLGVDPYEEKEHEEEEDYSYQCAECGSSDLDETDQFEAEISAIPFSLAFPDDHEF